MKYILITGSPLDGFIYEGPFDYLPEIMKFARDKYGKGAWWIAELKEPGIDQLRIIREGKEDRERLETKLDILENDYDEFENEILNIPQQVFGHQDKERQRFARNDKEKAERSMLEHGIIPDTMADIKHQEISQSDEKRINDKLGAILRGSSETPQK